MAKWLSGKELNERHIRPNGKTCVEHYMWDSKTKAWDESIHVCSECLEDVQFFVRDEYKLRFKCCPNCGAKMED